LEEGLMTKYKVTLGDWRNHFRDGYRVQFDMYVESESVYKFMLPYDKRVYYADHMDEFKYIFPEWSWERLLLQVERDRENQFCCGLIGPNRSD
jgi:hypothetical protein